MYTFLKFLIVLSFSLGNWVLKWSRALSLPFSEAYFPIFVRLSAVYTVYLPLVNLLLLDGDGLARSGTPLATTSSYSDLPSPDSSTDGICAGITVDCCTVSPLAHLETDWNKTFPNLEKHVALNCQTTR